MKRYTLVDKKQWAEDYEHGLSLAKIRGKYHCDMRTLKLGLEEVRKSLAVRAAEVEIVKTALQEHQEKLKSRLREIAASSTTPSRDTVVLSWHHGKEASIFEPDKELMGIVQTLPSKDIILNCLMEHLKNEGIKKLVAARDQAYESNKKARKDLQLRVVQALENATGLKLDDKPEGKHIYSYIAGDLFYRKAVAWAFGDRDLKWLDEFELERDHRVIRYQGSILVKIPGSVEECRDYLVRAFQEIRGLSEIIRLVNSERVLAEANMKVQNAAEEILALGVILGRCRICKRLDSQ